MNLSSVRWNSADVYNDLAEAFGMAPSLEPISLEWNQIVSDKPPKPPYVAKRPQDGRRLNRFHPFLGMTLRERRMFESAKAMIAGADVPILLRLPVNDD